MTRLLLAFPLALVLSACGDAEPVDHDDATGDPIEATPVDYSARGAWSAGYTVLEADAAGGAPLQVKAWYPTASTAAEDITYSVNLMLPGFGSDPMPFLGAAIADATPDAAGGPYPLVVLSHGFGLNPEWYHPLAEHLASHGMVVLAPEHTESDWATDVVPATVLRPLEVSATIDLATTGVLDGIIDTDRVAVAGHSYGGTAALTAGGARFHTDWLAEACPNVEDPFTDVMFCMPFLAGEAELAEHMGLAEVPEGLWPSLRDDRVDAVIAMAPDAFLFGDVGLAELTLPILVVGGTGDTGSPWGWGAGLTWDHVGSDTRGLVAFEGAEHFINVATCDTMPWTDGLPEDYSATMCEDPVWDKATALGITNEVAAAFLVHHLSGSEEASESLDPTQFLQVPGLDMHMVTE